MADDIASLIIKIDSKGAVKASGNLKKLTTQSGKTEKATDKVAASNKKSSQSFVMMAAKIGAAMLAYKAITGAFNAFTENTIKQEQAMRQLEAAVESTGSAAGLTAEELRDMAQGLQEVTTFGDESIMEMQGVLLTFTKLGKEVLPDTTMAVLDMATRMGTDLKSAALQLGKALNDPIKGLDGLGRAGVQFADDQRALIKELAATGEMAEAQKLILAELETQFGGSAVAARDTMGGALAALSNKFGDLFEASEETSSSIAGLINTFNSWIPATTNSEQKIIDLAKAAGVVKVKVDDLTLAYERSRKEAEEGAAFWQSQSDLDAQALEDKNALIVAEKELAAAKQATIAAKGIEAEIEAIGVGGLTEEEKLTRKQELNAAIVQGEVLHNAMMEETKQVAFDAEWARIDAQAAHEDEVFQIRMRNMTALDKFQEKSSLNKTKSVLGDMINMTQGVAQSNKKMFEINKAAATANAVVSTWQGAAKTMGEYPYPWNLAMAGLSLAAGMAQVSAIQGTSFAGGGGGGSVGGGGVPVAPSQAAGGGIPVVPTDIGAGATEPEKEIRVITTDDAIIGANGARRLLETLSDAAQDMGSNVKFVVETR